MNMRRDIGNLDITGFMGFNGFPGFFNFTDFLSFNGFLGFTGLEEWYSLHIATGQELCKKEKKINASQLDLLASPQVKKGAKHP